LAAWRALFMPLGSLCVQNWAPARSAIGRRTSFARWLFLKLTPSVAGALRLCPPSGYFTAHHWVAVWVEKRIRPYPWHLGTVRVQSAASSYGDNEPRISSGRVCASACANRVRGFLVRPRVWQACLGGVVALPFGSLCFLRKGLGVPLLRCSRAGLLEARPF
jgi:hypothetical protein